jgi:hypothetical protein
VGTTRADGASDRADPDSTDARDLANALDDLGLSGDGAAQGDTKPTTQEPKRDLTGLGGQPGFGV